MGLQYHHNLGFSGVSRVSRVAVLIRVSVRLRFSFSSAKLQETRRSITGVTLSVLPTTGIGGAS